MKKAAMVMIVAGLFATPVHAAEWSDARTGTFVGARLTIGGKTGGRPQAALTVAPTQNRISYDGRVSMNVSEGLSLNIAPASKPTLTLAGMPAYQLLGLTPGTTDARGTKLGMSDGAIVALGLGIAGLIAGGLYLAADHIADCDEGECD